MTYDLPTLGLRPAMLTDLDPETENLEDIVRVSAVHRDALEVLTLAGPARIRPLHAEDPLDRATVGDFVLVDTALERPARVLPRLSLFKRRAAGAEGEVQLIAANVDTAFVVSSCNADFNPARLERFLAVVREAGAEPVVILTKADLATDIPDYVDQARSVAGDALVEALDARDRSALDRLSPWLGAGQTVALLGSSGVGKTTLSNTLTGAEDGTAGIREDDGKGRHTTRARSMRRLASGGWVIDTPGLRELGLAGAAEGLSATFEGFAELEARCRFTDCGHDTEPGCAVRAALETGRIDEARWARYEKLKRENARNTESVAERRARSRDWGKFHKRLQQEHRKKKGL
ncbi:MAG: ribosome small subunit-dependent GTPase A [Oceanicaulis sp.]